MGLGYTEEKVSSSKCSGLMRGIAFALKCGKMKFRVVTIDVLRKSLRFILFCFKRVGILVLASEKFLSLNYTI
jgi:hypothetical protein